MKYLNAMYGVFYYYLIIGLLLMSRICLSFGGKIQLNLKVTSSVMSQKIRSRPEQKVFNKLHH